MAGRTAVCLPVRKGARHDEYRSRAADHTAGTADPSDLRNEAGAFLSVGERSDAACLMR